MTSFVGIIVKKIKNVHFSIVNTILGFVLTPISIIIWFFDRHIVNKPVEYNFTFYEWTLMIVNGIISAAGN